MKIGTDGVLLGAWTPIAKQPLSVLDVGSGTGLIALMLAQRLPKASVVGVEIDEIRQMKQLITLKIHLGHRV